MKHRRAGRKLNRDINQRKALFKNLIAALILKGKVQTTEAKAKAIRGLVDKLISKAKQGSLTARRLIAAFLMDKKAVNKLVDEVAPKLKQRQSGFTSMKRIKRRRGDNAVVVEVEILDQPKGEVADLAKRVTKKATSKKSEKVKTKIKPGRVKVAKPRVIAKREAAAIQKRGGGGK